MLRFFKSEHGYALVLSLIFMPVFLGFSLLMIDMGRGNNSHSDLQAAADAVALAGARELDGRVSSIADANAAMANLTNNVGLLGLDSASSNIELVFADTDGNEFQVIFLTDIPADDEDPIDQAFVDDNATTDGRFANYVHVIAQSQNLQTFFPVPVTFVRGDVPIQARATATYVSAACDVTPIYICNPFEGTVNPDINENFEQGNFYGRQLELQFTGASSPFPGNFGFLRTFGSGGSVLGEALATGAPGVCFGKEELDPEPGATVGPVEQGMNTRMGIYAGSYGNKKTNPDYRPAQNVRKGQEQSGNTCNGYSEETNEYDAMALPAGDGTPVTLPGGQVSQDSNWNLDLYWDVTHSGQDPHPLESNPAYVPPAAPAASIRNTVSSYPGGTTPATTTPSRYDVYRYEILQSLTGSTAPNGESGAPSCHAGYNIADYANDLDRRLIFGAIVNCLEHADDINGASSTIPGEAFGSFFMSKPVTTIGSNKSIHLELVDVTGPGGNGTLEEFLREEAVLVR
ncbi:MAG: pilus assembly protein TadG-related protein [Rhizobiaceae bacterium]